jgi:menaquinol-cytochrome c reductase iron-sulfur subunit
VLLVGLIVNLEVIAPLGGAIALLAAFRWIRGPGKPPRTRAAEPAASLSEANAERYSRSRLLSRATLGLGGIVAAAVALPAVGLSVLSSVRRAPDKPVDLGPIDAFPEGQFVISTFLADAQQGEISRRTAYVRYDGLVGTLPAFTILSSRCTHVGCPTQPNGLAVTQKRKVERTATGSVSLEPTAGVAGFGCPCHGSQFDNEGNRTTGPAARALDRYGFSVLDGHLWLGPRYSVSRVDGTGARARVHAFPLLDPGEPVTGPERLFYPIQPPR